MARRKMLAGAAGRRQLNRQVAKTFRPRFAAPRRPRRPRSLLGAALFGALFPAPRRRRR